MTKGQATAALWLLGGIAAVAAVNLFVTVKMAMGLQGASDTVTQLGQAGGQAVSALGDLAKRL